MLKKLTLAAATFFAAVSLSWAQVDINTASQAQLEAIKGIGPVKAKAIVEERTKNGPFKSADDVSTRVKGVGSKSISGLTANGLSIPGAPAAGLPAVAPGKAAVKNAPTAAVTEVPTKMPSAPPMAQPVQMTPKAPASPAAEPMKKAP